jgi:hypothetical protein
VKTEEFTIKGGTQGKILWIIITLKKGEDQDEKALIAEIMKAVK